MHPSGAGKRGGCACGRAGRRGEIPVPYSEFRWEPKIALEKLSLFFIITFFIILCESPYSTSPVSDVKFDDSLVT